MSTDDTPALTPDLAQAGPAAFAKPNRLEAHGFAEGARTAAMLARGPDTGPAIEARDDPAAGLAFVLGAVGPTTVVAILPDRGHIQARWLDAGTLAAVSAWAAERSKAGFNLYWTPNLPAPGQARKPAKADMQRLRALWADVDAKAGRTLAEANAAILALPMPAPSFITATGGGFQPVWLLDTPIPATPDAVAQAERDGAALASLCGGDAVQNVDRILRLPFTVNHPDARKREAGRVACPSGLVRQAGPVNRYSYADLTAGLPVPATPPRPHNVVQLPAAGRPAAFAGRTLPDMNAAAAAGLPGGFESLAPADMDRMLAAIASFPPFAALANAGRAEWRPLLWGFAHAEHLGAPGARRIGFKWSAGSRKFEEAENRRDWASYQPGRIGVGTLLDVARKAGFDLAPWFHPPAAPPAPLSALSPGGFMVPVRFGAADLRRVPWLVDGVLITGDLTVLAGQGGGAKTAAAVNLCVAIAAGRPAWGPHPIMPRADGAPWQALIMSGEEDANRVGLMTSSACYAMGLNKAERASVAANLMLHDARASGWRLGEPRPGEDIAPEGEDAPLAAMRDALAAAPLVGLVVLDPMAGLFAAANENDNNLMTRLMDRLARALREAGAAGLLIHHTPKMTREAAAGQRGEATLVRGGSAIVNSARVVLTLTGLPLPEAAAAAMSGMKADTLRRLETVKINDRARPDPAYLEVVGVQVTVADGSQHSIRAVRFIATPAPAGTGQPTAALNVAMRAIDAGAIVDGVRMPLSPGSGPRSATNHIAAALRAADPGLGEGHAKAAARSVLAELQGKLGCAVVQDVPGTKQAGGKANGRRMVKGLVSRWDLAPWMPAAHAVAPPAASPGPGRGPAPEAPDAGDLAGGATNPPAATHSPPSGFPVAS